MTFYRHFIERPEFETLVITPSRHVDDQPLAYTPIRIGLPRWWERVCRTRMLPWLYPMQVLFGDRLQMGSLLKQLQGSVPNAVFTVAGNWDWTALAAQRVAKTLDVPLIASFNDWFDYGGFPAHPRMHGIIERRFRRFYHEADLALCTSEGMREALGEHPNAHVWYPTGAPMIEEATPYVPWQATTEEPLTVFFGGSLGDWYGPMMESIVRECKQARLPVRFRIFGALETWSREFDAFAREEAIFGGRVDFKTLRSEALGADLLILPMGFGENCARVERTSFKTKFLDYLSFRRPILVWGPDYCSAVRVAREFDSAECVTDPSPGACRDAIERLGKDPERRRELMDNARRMYEDRFHPERIHEGLVEKVDDVIARHQLKQRR